MCVICGQGGVAGTIGGPEEKLFQRLLIYNSVRGMDSTGAGSVKRPLDNGKVRMIVAKEEGPPFELMSIIRKGQTNFGDILNGSQRALLGHCRAKTVGLPTRKNAHPFRFEHVMGTHNGTLSYQTQTNLIGGKMFDTDSEAFFYEIDREGITNTIKKMRRSSYEKGVHPDAYAIVWYDARDNSINFLRNKERPLYYAFSKDQTKLFWSSERGHLFSALTGDGCSIETEDKFLNKVLEDVHYSWTVPEFNQKFGKARAVKREGTPDPLVQTTRKGTSLFQGGQTGGGSTGTTSNSSANCSGIPPWGPDPFTGFYGKWDQANYGYLHAVYKHGPYYKTLQECWNSLSKAEQERRIGAGTYPSNINLEEASSNSHPRSNHPDLEDALTTQKSGYIPIKNRKEISAKATLKLSAIDDRFQKFTGFAALPSKVWEDGPELDNTHRKVFWDKDSKEFVVYNFKGFTFKPEECFEKFTAKICPTYVPYTLVNIDSNHSFSHRGRKKKKVVSYKGYKGDLLVRETFEKIMALGCLNCKRVPEWGNLVNFVEHKVFFCEHCARDEELVNHFRTGTNN